MAEPREPRTQVDQLTPKQRSRLRREIQFAHTHLAGAVSPDKDKFLASLDAHPDLDLFMDAYQAQYHESPQQTYNRAKIEQAGYTAPPRNPRKRMLGDPLPEGFTDRVFNKLTPDVQDDIAAQIALLMSSDATREVCSAWLEGRPALSAFYNATYPNRSPKPITSNINLTFHDRDDEELYGRLRRMVPAVRQDYLHQIFNALHNKDPRVVAECRSWLAELPKIKGIYEKKFGAKIGKKAMWHSDNAPAMKPPGAAFLHEFLRLSRAPEIFPWNHLHDGYPLAAPYIEKAVPALCTMLEGKYGREVRLTITDRQDSNGIYVTHAKLRAAMKRHIKLTYTDAGMRSAMLAKLENNLWKQPKPD